MNVCLVTAPVDLARAAAAPASLKPNLMRAPLGVLTLASELEAKGAGVELIDLDMLARDAALHGAPRADFAALAAQALASRPAPVFGFGSICSSYPYTLRVATALKRLRPDAFVMLGGPHASVTDVDTLRAFEAIDMIVRGEADDTLPRVLDARPADWPLLDGITWRQNGVIHRNPNAPPVLDLDSLPLPAFDLYTNEQHHAGIALELGRGCPFACAFCSTNDFFRRKFRLKSPAAVLAQMLDVEARYGCTRFELIHDMFTVDRRAVVRFCEALLASGRRYRWACSARTDCVDRPLLELMAQAGCSGIFFGIETGSQRLQHIIGKNLDMAQAARVLEDCAALGISTTASLIAGFPEERPSDFEDTVSFLANAARHDGCALQLHMLAPLPATPIADAHRDNLVPLARASDISGSGDVDAADQPLIAAYPAIFSNFYAPPTPHLDRAWVSDMRDWLLDGFTRYRWVMVALHGHTHLNRVFERWRTAGDPDWLRFFESSEVAPDEVIRALAAYYREVGESTAPQREEGERVPIEQLSENAIPQFAAGVRMLCVPFRMAPILAALRAGKAVAVERTPESLALRPRENGDAELLDLPSAAAELLALCDGTRSIATIAAALSARELFTRVSPLHYTALALRELHAQGLLEFRAAQA